ncbi:MAG TPA: ATP-binding protein [Myxococcales bacterium]|jgi:serine/threonine-protein kinase RsbT|nr:ATP-binding protein [Myxococcales bacterium]
MPRAREAVAEALGVDLTPLLVRSVVATLPSIADQEVEALDVVSGYELLRYAAAGVRIFAPTPPAELLELLHRRLTAGQPFRPTSRVLTVTSDADVVAAQDAAQKMVRGLLKPSDCIRAVTAVSELARNIYLYAKTGDVRLQVSEADLTLTFQVIASDRGPGIQRLDEILSGAYRSKTGLGRGLAGAKALLDTLDIQTGPQGTTIRGTKTARLSDIARNA